MSDVLKELEAGLLKEPDESMARHWIDRYAAGIDAEPQFDRIADALCPTCDPDTIRTLLSLIREERSAREKAERERDEATRDADRQHEQLHAVSIAIGSPRFMDPPDGGSVTLAEQVERMRETLDAAETRVEKLEARLCPVCEGCGWVSNPDARYSEDYAHGRPTGVYSTNDPEEIDCAKCGAVGFLPRPRPMDPRSSIPDDFEWVF